MYLHSGKVLRQFSHFEVSKTIPVIPAGKNTNTESASKLALPGTKSVAFAEMLNVTSNSTKINAGSSGSPFIVDFLEFFIIYFVETAGVSTYSGCNLGNISFRFLNKIIPIIIGININNRINNISSIKFFFRVSYDVSNSIGISSK